MLEARYKPDPYAFPGDRKAIARCDFPTCGAILARVVAGTDARGALCWSVNLEAGYQEIAPHVWKLTHHAAHQRNRRHTPRRPRTGGVTGFPVIGADVGPYAMSYPHSVSPLYAGDVMTIACPEHGHVNSVVLADVERDVQAVPIDHVALAQMQKEVVARLSALASAH